MKKLLLVTAFAFAFTVANAVKVASVKVESADGTDVNTGDVTARCQVKAGDEYDASECARDVRALRDTGEFDEITVKAERNASGGVDVTYVVKRKMRFQGPLQVKGNDYWGESKIASLSGLSDGYAYSEADLAAAAGRIKAEYQKKYFPNVKVKATTQPIPGNAGAVTVTMEIEEGERIKIAKFEFEGNESVEADELRASFNQYPWWNPLGWFADVPTTEQGFAEARDKVLATYRDKGYLDAEVSMPEAAPGEDEGEMNRVFKVTEGVQYKIGSMKVEGVKQYPAEETLAAVKRVKVGDVAGATALDEAAHEIEVFCGSGLKALAETRVSVKKLPNEENPENLDVVFAVEEGVPVTVNKVVIRGNDYTKDKVLRREIALSPGDPMLADKAERSKRRLENLRYFERVRYYLERVDGDPKDGERELRDLVYEVSEKNTGNFMIGIGAGSESSVFGQVELSESNFDLFNPWRFRGAGQKGRIMVQAGPRVQTYEASVTEPYFMDRLLELTVEVYRRQRWFDDYDVIRNGLAATMTYPVKFWPTWEAFGRLGFSVGAEMVQMDDVEDDFYYDKNGLTPDDRYGYGKGWLAYEDDKYSDNWEFPVRLFWQRDTRDAFIFPKNGSLVKLYGDVVAGDNEYWRLGFNWRQYYTVWKKGGHVLQFGLRGETVDAFSGDLPIYDRLFLGGTRSIRGVDFREIAPRIYSQEGRKGKYSAWGGQTSWCANIEYSVPVVKFVRLAAFTDLGSVGDDEFDFGTDWFCWSVGVGVRLDLEQFPIRLDFATPVVDPDEGVDDQVFSFSIGYDF